MVDVRSSVDMLKEEAVEVAAWMTADKLHNAKLCQQGNFQRQCRSSKLRAGIETDLGFYNMAVTIEP